MKRIDPAKELLLGGFNNPDNRYLICYIEEDILYTDQICVRNQQVYWLEHSPDIYRDLSHQWSLWASLEYFQRPLLQLWHEAQWFKLPTPEEFKKEFSIE